MSLPVKSGLWVGVCVVLLAVCYQQWTDFASRALMKDVIKGLYAFDKGRQTRFVAFRDDADKSEHASRPVRAAVGLGACMDVFVDAVLLWEKLKIQPPSSANFPESAKSSPSESEENEETEEVVTKEDTETHHDPLKQFHTLNDLHETFLQFFKRGAAVERYVHNTTLFRQIVAVLRDIPSAEWALGGNAPVMANRFAKEHCPVLLGARLSEQQASLLHENVSHISENPHYEDIHIIMEYKTGTQWGDFISPRANRFIIHSDQENPFLSSLEGWKNRMRDFDPDVVVISGLQMMDNYPYADDVMEKSLNNLREFLRTLPYYTRTHFEMASFVDEKLLQLLMKTVLPHTDSIGMNEQELPNLLSVLETGRVTEISTSSPQLSRILEQMRRMWKALSSGPPTGNEGGGKRKITRLHLHTLAYQVVLTRLTEPRRWTNTRRAAAAASLVAHRHACASKRIDVGQSKLLMDDSFSIFRRPNSPRILFNSTNPVACWEEGDVEICVAPVLVCTNVKQTAGGGDNISAAALVPQLQQADKEPHQSVPHYGQIE